MAMQTASSCSPSSLRALSSLTRAVWPCQLETAGVDGGRAVNIVGAATDMATPILSLIGGNAIVPWKVETEDDLGDRVVGTGRLGPSRPSDF